MKKALLIIAGTLALLLVGFLTYVGTRPAEYRVERSRTIPVEQAVLLPLVTDLRGFGEWNPWDARDPDLKKTYSDPSGGEGAWYTWEGNDDVGKGKMTISEVRDDGVTYHIEFIEPFASEADTAIAFEPAEGGTKVRWSMTGRNDFMGKMVGVFMDFDAMIGADFEKGLANMEARATAPSE